MLEDFARISGAQTVLSALLRPSPDDARRRDDMVIQQSTKSEIPSGLCQCGCGRATNLAPRTDRTKGWKAGRPLAYVFGHNSNVGKMPIAEIRKANTIRRPCKCGCGELAPLNSVTGRQCDYVRSHSGRINRRGYARIRVNGESVQEHAAIAARALGKPLPLGVQVHHVDENPRNNANSNLVICQDQKYHYLLHVRARVVRAGGNPNLELFCCLCKQPKLFADFNRNKNTGSGYQSACRACMSAAFKVWAAERARRKGTRAA